MSSFLPAHAADFLRAFGRFGGRRTVSATLLVIAGSLVEGLGLALLVPVLSILVRTPGEAQAVLARWVPVDTLAPGRLLPIVLALFCAMILLRAVILLARDRQTDHLAFGFADAQRERVIAALADASWTELASLRHSDVTQVLSGEVGNVAVAAHLLPQITVAAIMLAAQAAVLLAVSPALAGVAVVLALGGILGLARMARAAAQTGAAGARAGFWIADQIAALLGGLKFAAAHGLRQALITRVVAEGQALTAQRLDQRRRFSRGSVAASSVAALAGIVLIGAGTAIGVSAVALLAGLAIVLRMSGPMRTLQSSVPQFAALMPSFAAVSALCARLERSTDPVESADAAPTPALAGPIVARDLRLSYGDDSPSVLAGVDLDIAAGEMVGLAGSSGAGKTTILDILAGLRTPDAGTLTVAGTPVDAARLPAWRRHLAYVTQDTYLFDDSLRRNLVWGAADDSDDAAILAAVAAVGAGELVAALPDGLSTRVAERGLRFSGGQRQRLALARAILRRPHLILLDEATSALDLAAEQAVLTGVRAALPTATMVLVSHRPEALAICNRVVTLAAGRVVDAGV